MTEVNLAIYYGFNGSEKQLVRVAVTTKSNIFQRQLHSKVIGDFNGN